jgi:hypothetical protein
MKQWMKSKPVMILAAIAVGAYLVYCIRDFIRLSYTAPARTLKHHLAAVTNRFEGTPIGVSQNEEFLSRLKAVNASRAPTEVQRALRDYIAAYQDALDAAKSGGDASIYAQPMSESKERLRQALAKYD